MRLSQKKTSLIKFIKITTQPMTTSANMQKTKILNHLYSAYVKTVYGSYPLHNKSNNAMRNMLLIAASHDFKKLSCNSLNEQDFKELSQKYETFITRHQIRDINDVISHNDCGFGHSKMIGEGKYKGEYDISQEGRTLEESMKEDMKNKKVDIGSIGMPRENSKAHQMTSKDQQEADKLKHKCDTGNNLDACDQSASEINQKDTNQQHPNYKNTDKKSQDLGNASKNKTIPFDNNRSVRRDSKVVMNKIALDDAKPKNKRKTEMPNEPFGQHQQVFTNTIGEDHIDPNQRDNRSTYINHSEFRDNQHKKPSHQNASYNQKIKPNNSPSFSKPSISEKNSAKNLNKINHGPSLGDMISRRITELLTSSYLTPGLKHNTNKGRIVLVGSERELGQSGPLQTNRENLRESLYPKSEQPETRDHKTDVGKEPDNQSNSAYKENSRYQALSSEDNPEVVVDAEYKPVDASQRSGSKDNYTDRNSDQKNDNKHKKQRQKGIHGDNPISRKISNLPDGGESRGFTD